MSGFELRKPPTRRIWALCPHCGSKTTLFDNTASCRGVWVKCTRGCRQEFQLVIEDGVQKYISEK